MSNWEELFGNLIFISDLGITQTVELDNTPTQIGRYAAWVPIEGTARHQIVEIGDDLNYLTEKYRVPLERICTLS